MKLKQKHVNITIDDVADTDTLKALTTTAQTIDGEQVFTVAPRVLNPSPSPGERHLVTEAMLNEAIAAVIANGQNLNWEFLPDGGVELVEWMPPTGEEGVPIIIVDDGKKYPLPILPPEKPKQCTLEYRKCKKQVYRRTYRCGWEPEDGGMQQNQYTCRLIGVEIVLVDVYEAVVVCP